MHLVDNVLQIHLCSKHTKLDVVGVGDRRCVKPVNFDFSFELSKEFQGHRILEFAIILRAIEIFFLVLSVLFYFESDFPGFCDNILREIGVALPR